MESDGQRDRLKVIRSKKSWIQILGEIDRELENCYKTPDLGNLPDPTDELFYILLSNRSDPSRYGEVFKVLKDRVENWESLLDVPVIELCNIVEPLGLAAQRSERFRDIAHRLYKNLGTVSLEVLRNWATNVALSFLKKLPGVGEKSARCVLMYSLGRDVFPIDSHIHRIAVRVGLVPLKWSLKKVQQRFDTWLPVGVSLRLHVNMVVLGRLVCHPRRPECVICPVNQLCLKKGVRKS